MCGCPIDTAPRRRVGAPSPCVESGDLPDVGHVWLVTVYYIYFGDFLNRNASAVEHVCSKPSCVHVELIPSCKNMLRVVHRLGTTYVAGPLRAFQDTALFSACIYSAGCLGNNSYQGITQLEDPDVTRAHHLHNTSCVVSISISTNPRQIATWASCPWETAGGR